MWARSFLGLADQMGGDCHVAAFLTWTRGTLSLGVATGRRIPGEDVRGMVCAVKPDSWDGDLIGTGVRDVAVRR